MKKIIIFTIISLLALSAQANQVKINISVVLDGKYKQDTIYVGLYSTYQSVIDGRHQLPDASYYEMISSPKKSTDFDVLPGYYLINIWAYGYQPAKQLLYVDPKAQNVKVEFTLKSQIIGWSGEINDVAKINTVQVSGELTQNNNGRPLNLKKVGNVWKLEEKQSNMQTGMWYWLRVNGETTDDLLNPRGIPHDKYLAYKTIYTGNDIIFDPSVYSLVKEQNTTRVSGELPCDENFIGFSDEMNKLNEDFAVEIQKTFRSSKEETRFVTDLYIDCYKNLCNTYPEFSQIIFEKQLEIYSFKLPILFSVDRNMTEDEREEKTKEFFLSPAFDRYFSNVLSLIHKLDPNSFLLQGGFVSMVNFMQIVINDYPNLAEKYNLDPNYFENFLAGFIKNTQNEKLACNLLFQSAKSHIQKDQDKAGEILEDLMSNYDYQKYIDQSEMDQLLARINVQLGKMAPDFSTTLLNGETFTLSKQKGKYVFIDFWGTWCAPCLKEIPHIKKLYGSVSRNKLEVIGLAEDTDQNLRKYIGENNIEYPNSLASRELLAKFGIMRFPTSFLINPEGIIVKLDMRGEDAMHFIEEEINNYFN